MWLEEINLGSYCQIFKENGVNGEYLEGMSMFTTEQILRFIRKCHMKWGDFITLCKELRRIKGISSPFNVLVLVKFWFELDLCEVFSNLLPLPKSVLSKTSFTICCVYCPVVFRCGIICPLFILCAELLLDSPDIFSLLRSAYPKEGGW